MHLRKDIRTRCFTECCSACWSSYFITDTMSQYEISIITNYTEYGVRWKGKTRFMSGKNALNIFFLGREFRMGEKRSKINKFVNVCFKCCVQGDSGGPLVVYNDGKFEIIGIGRYCSIWYFSQVKTRSIQNKKLKSSEIIKKYFPSFK